MADFGLTKGTMMNFTMALDCGIGGKLEFSTDDFYKFIMVAKLLDVIEEDEDESFEDSDSEIDWYEDVEWDDENEVMCWYDEEDEIWYWYDPEQDSWVEYEYV